MASSKITKSQEMLQGLNYAFEVTVHDPSSKSFKPASGRITAEELDRRSKALKRYAESEIAMKIPEKRLIQRRFRYEVPNYNKMGCLPDKVSSINLKAWEDMKDATYKYDVWRKNEKRLRMKHIGRVSNLFQLFTEGTEKYGLIANRKHNLALSGLREMGLGRVAELLEMGYLFSHSVDERPDAVIRNVIPQWVWLGFFLSSEWDALDFVYTMPNGEMYEDQELARIVYCGEKIPDEYLAGDSPSANLQFKPYAKQTYFLGSNVYEILYGGARGGGKTFAMIHDAALHVRKFHYDESGGVVIDRQSIDYHDYTALILRRKYTDLVLNFKPKAQHVYKQLGAQWKEKEMCFVFPSGARIYLGYCNEGKDVDKYIGGNYHYLGVEEVGQFPEMWLRDIASSVRSTNKELPPLIRFTTNPGGVGHMWLKRKFVDKCPPVLGETKHSDKFDVDYQEQNPGSVYTENGVDRWYIPANVFDNPALVENDDTYVSTLKKLDPVKRGMWLHGKWDEMSGLFFDEFANEYHVIDERDFELDKSKCRIYRCVDYGTANPFACMFAAVYEDGKVIIFDEIYQTGLTPSMQAELIVKATQEWGLEENDVHLTIVDPAMKVASHEEIGRAHV